MAGLPESLLLKASRDGALIASRAGVKKTLWQELDEFIPAARLEVNIEWPESVFMPFGLWPCFLERHFRLAPGSFNLDEPVCRGTAQLMSALAAWRPTQDIVSFDPDVLEEIRGMGIGGRLASSVFLSLPAWCVWLDCPGITVDGDEYEGFFAQLDTTRGGLFMALTFERSDFMQNRVPIALGDFTLEESLAQIARTASRIGEAPPPPCDAGLAFAVNMVTYLCAYGFSDRQDSMANAPQYPKPRKTKIGWRIFPPDRPRRHLLGVRFGEAIRTESRTGAPAGSGTKRPHLRRPHWHSFWTGAMDSPDRRLTARWLPPIFVGRQEKDDEP